MNPIGIDFSRIFADPPEGEPQQAKVSNAEEKDFLAQFLGMLFADSETASFPVQGKSDAVDSGLSIDGEEQEAVEWYDEKDDPIIKGVSLGILLFGVYGLDKLLGEEKYIKGENDEPVKIKRGFLEELFK